MSIANEPDPIELQANLAAGPRTSARNGGLDALRAALTLLVILHHTAITYGGSGGWFYREAQTDGSLSSLLLTFFCAVNQSYFMGLFFLLAGYFIPASMRSKGMFAFLKDRLIRLGIPFVLFGFVLGPMTLALARAVSMADFFARWGRLMAEPAFIHGPLWFAQALLIFAGLAVLLVRLKGADHGTVGSTKAAAQHAPGPAFPRNATIACAALCVGLAAFLLRLLWPTGTNVWGLQPGFFASYTALFAAGYLGAKGRSLERIPLKQSRFGGGVALLIFPLLPAAIVLSIAFPQIKGSFEGGWNALAAIYAFWEPLMAWGLILTLLVLFQRRFAVLTPLGKQLVARAYAIFILHPPVLVAVALAWRGVGAPLLLKFLITGALTCWLCYLLAGWLLKVPGAKRVL